MDASFGCVQDRLDRVDQRRRAHSGGVGRSFGGVIGMLRGLVIREDREGEDKRMMYTRKEGYNGRPKGAGRIIRKNAAVVYMRGIRL